MEACEAVEKEIDKVNTKFSSLRNNSEKSLQELLEQIEKIQSSLNDEQPLQDTTQKDMLESIYNIRELVNRLSADHKDLHGTVSKVGKAIDRNFVSDFTGVTTTDAFDEPHKQDLIARVIGDHFLRDGMLDVLQSFSQETNIHISDAEREPFIELHRILDSLQQHNLEPALRWAEQNSDRTFMFKLHRLHFIELLKGGNSKRTELLNYAQNFAPYAEDIFDEIKSLMGCLMYIHQDLDKSPYKHLLTGAYWDEICEVFTQHVCTHLGLPVESKLSITTQAGCIALPPLLSIQQVMQQRQCSNVWNAKDKLPIEIDLGRMYRFHSIFACPILRQQCTDTNPPVRLVCGHVISRDALNKLSNGSKVKCPYCTQEQNPADPVQVFF